MLKWWLYVHILHFIGDVRICTTICKSLWFFICGISVSNHCCQLCRRISSLECIVHLVIAVNGKVTGLTTDLAGNPCAVIEKISLVWLQVSFVGWSVGEVVMWSVLAVLLV
jgi:hypothetical protein